MKNSDKFFAQHYAKKIDKQMEDDINEAITEEVSTGRKQEPAYVDQAIPGMKHKHGGTIGFTEGGNR